MGFKLKNPVWEGHGYFLGFYKVKQLATVATHLDGIIPSQVISIDLLGCHGTAHSCLWA